MRSLSRVGQLRKSSRTPAAPQASPQAAPQAALQLVREKRSAFNDIIAKLVSKVNNTENDI